MKRLKGRLRGWLRLGCAGLAALAVAAAAPQAQATTATVRPDPDGDDWGTLAHLHRGLTNCETLLEALPACPQACPIAAVNSDVVGTECSNYHRASDILRTRARWVAQGAVDARQREAKRTRGTHDTASKAHLA